MGEKKASSRFCVQFNEKDSRHRQVMEILNVQGRHKAHYIALAVLHYINCNESPANPQEDITLRQTVEAIVAEILDKRTGQPETTQLPAGEDKPKRKIRQSAEIGVDDTELNADTVDIILDSLAGFRSMEI